MSFSTYEQQEFYDEFQKVLKVSCQLSIDMNETKVENWEQEITSDFFGLICQYCLTIKHTILPHKGGLRAIPSAFVILRATYETYLNMHYVCVKERSENERKFLEKSWRRNEIATRLKIVGFIRRGEESQNPNLQRPEEKLRAEINVLTNELEQLEIMGSKPLFPEEKWTFNNITNRAIQEVGIEENLHRYLYKTLSCYSHGDPYAISCSRPNPSDLDRDSITISIFATMILLWALQDFSSIYEPVKDWVDSKEELGELILFYEEIKETGWSYKTSTS